MIRILRKSLCSRSKSSIFDLSFSFLPKISWSNFRFLELHFDVYLFSGFHGIYFRIILFIFFENMYKNRMRSIIVCFKKYGVGNL